MLLLTLNLQSGIVSTQVLIYGNSPYVTNITLPSKFETELKGNSPYITKIKLDSKI